MVQSSVDLDPLFKSKSPEWIVKTAERLLGLARLSQAARLVLAALGSLPGGGGLEAQEKRARLLLACQSR